MIKKLLALVALSIPAASFAQTFYPGGIPGCIARYSFNNVTSATVSDVSGNGNVGTATNTISVAGWRGAANGALKFDGSTSFVQVADAAILRPQQLTMVALVRYDGFYTGNCQGNQIFSKGYPGFTPGVYGLGSTDNIYDNSCSVATPTQQMRADMLGPNMPAAPQTSPLQTGKWYFVAATFDGSNYVAYQATMDSTNMLSAVSSLYSFNALSAIGTNTQNLTIGKHSDPSYPYWIDGAIDEVALFNRALSASEIYKVYYFLFNGYALGVADQEIKKNEVTANAHDGRVLLQTADGSMIGDIILYNLQGQVLASKTCNSISETLDISSMPKEMLFIKVAHKDKVETIKVPNL